MRYFACAPGAGVVTVVGKGGSQVQAASVGIHQVRTASSTGTGRSWAVGGLFWLALLLLTSARVSASVPRLDGWKLQFSDDFSGAAGQLPSASAWRFDTGHGYPGGPMNWGTREIQTYTDHPANVSLDGKGDLRITPLRSADGAWTSARIETRQDNFRPPRGGLVRMQVRAQMPDVSGPDALGYWPAFWALGQSFRRNGGWPQAGEFDIMENVNGLDTVWGTLHCGMLPEGPCGEPNGIGQHLPCPGVSCQSGFHTYTFEWDQSVTPQALRWYVDGKLYGSVTADRLPAQTWKQITGQRGYFLLLDVAMGGNFAYALAGGMNTPVATTVSGHPMLVDYVAVWTRDAEQQREVARSRRHSHGLDGKISR